MSYHYKDLRSSLFNEENQKMFLTIRDNAKRLTREAGAASMECLISGLSGDVWTMMACVDRLVELKELVEIPNTVSRAGQYRIFIAPYECL